MSRPKRRTPESDKFVHEQALYRVDMLSNKQIAHALAQMGVNITPNYVGELVKQAERRIREDRELSRRAQRRFNDPF